jgi:LPS-assembly lipoprotein
MKNSRYIKLILMLSFALALSACGFALRGAVNLPFSSIYVGMPDSSSLGGELKRHIRANGNTIIEEKASEATVILDVLSESREKVILSLNSQGRVREFNLIYNFRFHVRNKAGKEVLEPTTISLKRSLSYKENEVLAKESEEALLYRDMQSDLVQQIMRRLAVMRMDVE